MSRRVRNVEIRIGESSPGIRDTVLRAFRAAWPDGAAGPATLTVNSKEPATGGAETDTDERDETESEWPGDVDWDEQRAMHDEFREIGEEYLNSGMHPEQVAMTLHLLRGTFDGMESDEHGPDAFNQRASYRLFETLQELETDDDIDGSWSEIEYVLNDLYDLARSQARRERRSDDE